VHQQQQQLHPYHRQKVQAMGLTNQPWWQELSHGFVQHCSEKACFPNIVLYAGEASCSRGSIISSQNNHVWTEENFQAKVEQRHQPRFSISVCHVIRGFISDLYVLHMCLDGPVYMKFWSNHCQNYWRMCQQMLANGSVSFPMWLLLVFSIEAQE